LRRNHGATERIDAERHETTRGRVRIGREFVQDAQDDPERHQTTRTVVDMESNKDLK
jgi:hypothetical protein